MPRLELKLRVDPKTGRQVVEVHYESDADALPMEHEEEHRALVKKVFEGHAVEATRVAERPRAAPVVADPEVVGQGEAARKKQGA